MSTNDMVYVTRFEPEVIQTLARRLWHGSEERVPTTPVWKAVVHGVTLRSRYRKVEDFTRMGAMLESVEPRWRSAILDIWCDSIPARYRVTLRGRFREVAQLIGDQLEAAQVGHKGILVQDPAGGTLYRLASNCSESKHF
jgi:hypothetical protein